MTRPIVIIHDIETDEVIERPMNDEEFSDFTERKTAFEATKADEEAKATAKQALLNQLGITAEQAKLLLS